MPKPILLKSLLKYIMFSEMYLKNKTKKDFPELSNFKRTIITKHI